MIVVEAKMLPIGAGQGAEPGDVTSHEPARWLARYRPRAPETDLFSCRRLSEKMPAKRWLQPSGQCVFPPDDGTNRSRGVLVALRDGSSHFQAVEEEEEAVKR